MTRHTASTTEPVDVPAHEEEVRSVCTCRSDMLFVGWAPLRFLIRVRVSYGLPSPATAKIGSSILDSQGLDLRLQATALARAEMRSNTPSAKVAARAVRSLKKKLARIREWELAKESGKEISSEQVNRGG